jgi:hypothetical protein
LTVGVFGVTNSTCGDSSQRYCNRNAAVGKMSFWASERGTTGNMKKPAVNHHKAHKSPQWRTCAWSPNAGVPLPGSCRRAVASAVRRGRPAPARRRLGGRVSLLRWKCLNWTLRRYVRASSLRVWLRRQAPEAGGAPVPAGGNGPRCVGGRLGAVLAGAVLADTVLAGSSAPAGRPRGVALPTGHTLRYGIHRNRQMEHLTQVAEGLRGGVRRGAAITTRERGAARDLVLATLSDRVCV